jgi:hypothetical protein
MLKYLNTADSNSDFISESDIVDTSEEDAPHAKPQAAHPVSKSEEDDTDDETTGKFCHLSSLSLFLSNSKNCLDLSIFLLLLLTSIFSSQT